MTELQGWLVIGLLALILVFVPSDQEVGSQMGYLVSFAVVIGLVVACVNALAS